MIKQPEDLNGWKTLKIRPDLAIEYHNRYTECCISVDGAFGGYRRPIKENMWFVWNNSIAVFDPALEVNIYGNATFNTLYKKKEVE